ncbi:DUF2271 domain-containing protein [Brevundimonas sp. Root1423]|uniref:DUF2271 domain-containing protein n=1 Tax=Brevundimonas sp. Root1423 TaxID=1736462 RepID=UPI0006FBE773|nr:DUF2271 domain-containing protein [Brevundimonas sp. Root1423]KQY84891.1 hypothetical protein ASD25_07735 [Brevundimonas sp. Root1423]
MRQLPLILTATAAAAVAGPALAADITVSVEVPRLSVAAYHRPYVAVWIERPDNTPVRTVAVWYEVSNVAEGKDWLKDMRTWWRRGGRSLSLPMDGVSSATKAPGRHAVRIPAARLRDMPAGDYVMVVEAARELGGREAVRVPFRWGAANTARGAGSTELGAVSVAVTR